ncbi:MAG: hypothetical protein RLO18_29310 [Gimesia chilikensis]
MQAGQGSGDFDFRTAGVSLVFAEQLAEHAKIGSTHGAGDGFLETSGATFIDHLDRGQVHAFQFVFDGPFNVGQ